MVAASHGRLEAVERMLALARRDGHRRAASLACAHSTRRECTALHAAAAGGHVSVARALLEAAAAAAAARPDETVGGGDKTEGGGRYAEELLVAAQATDGRTALMLAAAFGRAGMIEVRWR